MRRGSTLVLGCLIFSTAWPHSASDAYLTLSADTASSTTGRSVAAPVVMHGQWDIALRDLDFLLSLDDDGNGQVTWGEVRHHRPEIERYAYAHLQFGNGSGACTLEPQRLLIDDHADGAYAALFFDVACRRVPKTLTMNYTLFFAIDPSHRGIFILHEGTDTSTAVLSPQNSKVVIATPGSTGGR